MKYAKHMGREKYIIKLYYWSEAAVLENEGAKEFDLNISSIG